MTGSLVTVTGNRGESDLLIGIHHAMPNVTLVTGVTRS
jgi:hypothetical protein